MSDTIEHFTESYRVVTSETDRLIEKAVIGGDWGANGYTTKAQADRLARSLDLRPEDRLIDVGAGRGWPGLYLAKTTRCHVVIADVPYEGLRSGMMRARAEGLGERVGAVRCDATSLPFAPSSFDAMVHTDVLC
jgi:ubiquinone/menaquinone biosynthesis C-methylase UbiE